MFSCCCRSPNLSTSTPRPLTGQFQELGNHERVFRHIEDHKKRGVDYCLNGVLTFVGIAMVAFSVAMILLSYHTIGYTSSLLPIYGLYGGIGVLGVALTVLSVKWMVNSCQKSIEYDRLAGN